MAVFNGMFPIQAGREEDARAFAAEAVGSRRDGFEAHHARSGTSRETWSLQETPVGSFMLVWFEGDPEKAFADLATDDSEFTTWFCDRVPAALQTCHHLHGLAEPLASIHWLPYTCGETLRADCRPPRPACGQLDRKCGAGRWPGP